MIAKTGSLSVRMAGTCRICNFSDGGPGGRMPQDMGKLLLVLDKITSQGMETTG
jgi:hypothetical protein